MFYVNYLIFIITFFVSNTFAQDTKLPKLSTKQDVNNLRYLSNDGKYTYYQRRSGALVFATNFKVSDVVKNDVGTHYNVISSRHKNNLLVSANTTQFTFLEPRMSKIIYVVPYGENRAKEIGRGNNPQLHLKASWASFYDNYERELHFVNIINPALRYKIKLPSKPNPYFTPSAFMVDSRTILYIDQNEKGVYGLIQFDRSTKKSKLLYKLEDPFSRLEICNKNEDIFIGSFSLHSYSKSTEIHKIVSLKNFKLEQIYNSSLSDVGHMICDLGDENIYFIKTINKKGVSELAQISLKKKSNNVKVLSDLKYITQLIEMDGKLLIPFRGDFYVPLGENNYANIDSLSDIKKRNIKKNEEAPLDTVKKANISPTPQPKEAKKELPKK